MKLALLGDSILDNEAYTMNGLSVAEHLQVNLTDSDEVVLLAVDGSLTSDVQDQLLDLPADITHVVVSSGGNDALLNAGDILGSQANILETMTEVKAKFRRDYSQMLDLLTEKNVEIVTCTIYDAVPSLGEVEKTALSIFNDVILRESFSRHHACIDLRLVCTEEEHYCNWSPIEPSESGGGLIAQAILRAVGEPHPASTVTI